MKRYYIEDAKFGVTDGGMACGPCEGSVIVAVKFSTEGNSKWIYNVEVTGIPNYYISEEDLFEKLMAEDFDDDEFYDYINENCYVREFEGITLGEYEDTFESISANEKNPVVPVLRLLISLTRLDGDECEDLIEDAVGEYADEIEIPRCDIEIDNGYGMEPSQDFQALSKEDLFKSFLFLETDIKEENVFKDMDTEVSQQEEVDYDFVNGLIDQDEYSKWKEAYINDEYEKNKDIKFLSCEYMFAGMGSYTAIIPADELESFKCWINGNGSAFLGTVKDATEEDIKKYIALHANDEV